MADKEVSKVRVPDGTSNIYVLKDKVARSRTEYETTTKTGNPIVLESGGQSVDDLKVQLEPIQDLHGYDHPWVGGAGTNLLPMTVSAIKALNTSGTWNGNNYIWNGITYSILTDDADNVIGFNTNGTATARGWMFIAEKHFDDDSRAYGGSEYAHGANYSYYAGFATGEAYIYYNSYSNRSYILIPDGFTANNQKWYPIVRVKTTDAPSFEPYSNICPISGRTEANVLRTGKNIADTSVYKQNYVLASDGAENSAMYYAITNAVRIVGGAYYSFSFTKRDGGDTDSLRVGFYDENMNFIRRDEIYWVTAEGTILAPSNAVYFRLSYKNVNPSILNIQAEAENLVTAYEPYTGQTVTVSLGQTVYGGTLDVTTGELVVDKQLITLTGSENYYDENVFIVKAIAIVSRRFTSYKTAGSGECSHFTAIDYVPTTDAERLNSIWKAGNDFLGFKTSMFTTGADAKAWVTEQYNAGTPVTYALELAEPVTIQLTPQQLKTLVGTNIFTSESGTVEVKIRDGLFMLAGEEVGGAEWGKIGGNLSDQDDLNDALSAINRDLTSAQEDIDAINTATSTEETEPYLFKSSARENVVGNLMNVQKIIGGTVAWNQLAPVVSVSTSKSIPFTQGTPLVAGHKYLFKAKFANTSGSSNISVFSKAQGRNTNEGNVTLTNTEKLFSANNNAVSNGSTSETDGNVWLYAYFAGSNTISDVQLIDLTQMFGSTIADYIYSLEQSTAGAGVAWFRKLFPNDYYPYNAGELISVKTSAHVMRGFNQWDEEWESGTIDPTTGQNSINAYWVRSKNYIHVIGGTSYYYSHPYKTFGIRYYDAEKNYIGYVPSTNDSAVNTTPENCAYVRITLNANTYDDNICINISKTTGTPKNGDYVPYEKHTYPLDPDLELHGIPKLDSNNKLYYDGDEYEPSGTVTRKYYDYTVSVLNIYVRSSNPNNDFATTQLPYAWSSGGIKATNVITSWGGQVINSLDSNLATGTVATYDTASRQLAIALPKGTTLEQAQTLFDNKHIVYELATPTTETADAYDKQQVFDVTGTEEYVDTRTVQIPVGHNTFFPASITSRIDALEEEFNEEIAAVSTYASVNVTLASSSWDSDTKVYTISNSNVTATSLQVIVPAVGITDTQLKALQSANIQDYGQDAGHIYLKAYGDLPSVDVPITVIFFPMTSA